MVSLREPRARRSVACIILSGACVGFVAYIALREVQGPGHVSTAYAIAALALAVLAFVWRDQ